ncbi:hypothetical protein, partial [Parabacteroides johnsonii]|uniref:hypothetical protein n=1 Tax=Parabacteroides johnsonii TaxID=387661 RepID=UPI0040296306
DALPTELLPRWMMQKYINLLFFSTFGSKKLKEFIRNGKADADKGGRKDCGRRRNTPQSAE